MKNYRFRYGSNKEFEFQQNSEVLHKILTDELKSAPDELFYKDIVDLGLSYNVNSVGCSIDRGFLFQPLHKRHEGGRGRPLPYFPKKQLIDHLVKEST